MIYLLLLLLGSGLGLCSNVHFENLAHLN